MSLTVQLCPDGAAVDSDHADTDPDSAELGKAPAKWPHCDKSRRTGGGVVCNEEEYRSSESKSTRLYL